VFDVTYQYAYPLNIVLNKLFFGISITLAKGQFISMTEVAPLNPFYNPASAPHWVYHDFFFRQDRQDLQDFPQKLYPVDPVNPVKGLNLLDTISQLHFYSTTKIETVTIYHKVYDC